MIDFEKIFNEITNRLIYSIPIVTVLLFIISLCFYVSAVRQNKKVPGTFSCDQVEARMILLIVSSVFAVFAIAVLILIAVILMSPVEFM